MAVRRGNFTTRARQYNSHPYHSQDRPPYNSDFNSRTRQCSEDRHNQTITKLFDTPSSSSDHGFSEKLSYQDKYRQPQNRDKQYPPEKYSQPQNQSYSNRERPNPEDSQEYSNRGRHFPEDQFNKPRNESHSHSDRQFLEDKYQSRTQSYSNVGRQHPEDKYRESHSNSDRQFSEDKYSQSRTQSYSNRDRQYPVDKYSESYSTSDRQFLEDKYSQSHTQSFNNSDRQHPQEKYSQPRNQSYSNRDRQYPVDKYSQSRTQSYSNSDRQDPQDKYRELHSNSERQFPQDKYSQACNQSYNNSEGQYPVDKYRESHSNSDRQFLEDKYSQSRNQSYSKNDGQLPRDRYSQPRNELYGKSESQSSQDKYSQPHHIQSHSNSDRRFPQDKYSQPGNQPGKRLSNDETESNASWSSSRNQSYKSNEGFTMPRSSQCEEDILARGSSAKDVQRFSSSQLPLIPNTYDGFKESGPLLENPYDFDGSEEDDAAIELLDMNKREDLLKYIDKILFAKQSELLDAIEKYNEMVRKFDVLGRVFMDPNDKRMYLHWRRWINKLSGVIKKDMTFTPPNQFRLDQFLIDKNQVPGLGNDPAQRRFNSGLPKPNINPNLKKGLKVHMQQRLFAKEKIDCESIALEKLRGKPEQKIEMFGELAKAHWESKIKQKSNPKARFEAKKLTKQMRKKLKKLAEVD